MLVKTVQKPSEFIREQMNKREIRKIKEKKIRLLHDNDDDDDCDVVVVYLLTVGYK